MNLHSIQQHRRSRKARWQSTATYAERRLVHRFGFQLSTAKLIAEMAFPAGEARR